MHPNDTTQDNWIRIAHLLRPQGRRGELLAKILTDFPDRFAQLPSAFLMPVKRADAATQQPVTPVILESHWLHKECIVLKFRGVDSITAAEALRGMDVVIPPEQRVPLTDGAVYIDDLIGCALVDTGQPGAPVVGTIRDVEPQPQGTDLLVVAGKDASGDKTTEHLIPFAKAFLGRIDLTARRVEMALPVGLLTMNAPLSAEEKALEQEETSQEESED